MLRAIPNYNKKTIATSVYSKKFQLKVGLIFRKYGHTHKSRNAIKLKRFRGLNSMYKDMWKISIFIRYLSTNVKPQLRGQIKQTSVKTKVTTFNRQKYVTLLGLVSLKIVKRRSSHCRCSIKNVLFSRILLWDCFRKSRQKEQWDPHSLKILIHRWSHPEVFYKIGVLKISQSSQVESEKVFF